MNLEEVIDRLKQYPVKVLLVGILTDMDGDYKFGSCICGSKSEVEVAIKKFDKFIIYYPKEELEIRFSNQINSQQELRNNG